MVNLGYADDDISSLYEIYKKPDTYTFQTENT